MLNTIKWGREVLASALLLKLSWMEDMDNSIKTFLFLSILLLPIRCFALPQSLKSLIGQSKSSEIKIIHNMKYPFKEALKFDAGFYYLYGDKFITSYGVSLAGQYFLNRTWSVKLAAIFLDSGPSKAIVRYYGLAQDHDKGLGGDLAHLLVMQHVSKKLIDQFINDLKEDLIQKKSKNLSKEVAKLNRY